MRSASEGSPPKGRAGSASPSARAGAERAGAKTGAAQARASQTAAAPAPPPAPAPSLEEDLRTLGARPVKVVQKTKEKPRTAREALRAKTAARNPSQPPASGAGKPKKTRPPSERAEDVEDAATEPDATASTEPAGEDRADAADAPAPVSLWARMKRLFGR